MFAHHAFADYFAEAVDLLLILFKMSFTLVSSLGKITSHLVLPYVHLKDLGLTMINFLLVKVLFYYICKKASLLAGVVIVTQVNFDNSKCHIYLESSDSSLHDYYLL